MSINPIKEDEVLSSVSKRKTLIRLFRYLLDYKLTILLVLIIMLITVSISIINPLLIKRAIDIHIAQGDIEGLIILGLITLGINILFVALLKL